MKKNLFLSVLGCIFMLISLCSCGNESSNNPSATKQGIVAEETGAKYTVPDVTGKAPLEAAAILEKTGFTNIRSNISDKAELEAYKWIVVSQSVSAGESLVYNKPIVLNCKKQLQLYLDLKSETNLIFSTYDVDVKVDGKDVGSIANGANFTYLIDVLEGTHQIQFNKAGDNSVNATKSVEMSDNTTFQCTIAHSSSAIELKNQNTTQNVNGSALKMPDVIGKVLPEAKNELQKTGFINVDAYAENDSIWTDANWIVIEQNQKKGTSLDKTEKIELKCIKLDKFFNDEFSEKTLREVVEKAKASGFSLYVKDNDTYKELSMANLPDAELDDWKCVSADKYSDKTARVYVKSTKVTTTVTTTTQKKSETTTTAKAVDRSNVSEKTKESEKAVGEITTKTEPAVTYLDNELKINYPRPTGNPNLRKGDEGDEVGWLQTVLNKVLNQSSVVDCKFGNGTQSNVIEFQSRAGLQPDGAVGPKTIEKLVEVATGRSSLPKITTVKETPPIISYTEAKPDNSYVSPSKQNQGGYSGGGSYVCNTNSHIFHDPNCPSAKKMKDSNKEYASSRDEAISRGYVPCQKCNP